MLFDSDMIFSRVKATQQFALTLSPSVGLSIRPSHFIFHGVYDTPFCVQVLGKVDERYRVKKSKSVFDFLTYTAFRSKCRKKKIYYS